MKYFLQGTDDFCFIFIFMGQIQQGPNNQVIEAEEESIITWEASALLPYLFIGNLVLTIP